METMDTMDDLSPFYRTVWKPYYCVDTIDKIHSDSKSVGNGVHSVHREHCVHAVHKNRIIVFTQSILCMRFHQRCTRVAPGKATQLDPTKKTISKQKIWNLNRTLIKFVTLGCN